jgi:hypothetical protein
MCRRINEFKKSYCSRSNLTKDEKADLYADFHILSRWKNSVIECTWVSDIRQIGMRTVGPLVPELSRFWVEKVKNYNALN